MVPTAPRSHSSIRKLPFNPPNSASFPPAAAASAPILGTVGGASTFTDFTCSISRAMRVSSATGMATCVISGASCTMMGIPAPFEIASK